MSDMSGPVCLFDSRESIRGESNKRPDNAEASARLDGWRLGMGWAGRSVRLHILNRNSLHDVPRRFTLRVAIELRCSRVGVPE